MKFKHIFTCAALSALWMPSLQAAPPANDNFASAAVITGNTGTQAGTNVDATLETFEPSLRYRSIWYSWTAPATGSVTFDTIGSGFDTMLGIYTGTAVNELTTLATDDGSGGGSESLIILPVTSGTIYWIKIGSYALSHPGAPTMLRWTLVSQPANDNFAAAQALPGDTGTLTEEMVAATLESGETTLGNKSIWYIWTPASSGLATVDTIGSSNDTTLLIYQGTTLNSLASIVSSDNGYGVSGYESQVEFVVTSGSQYYVRVGSYSSGVTLPTVLNWSITPTAVNDNFAAATAITGASGTITGDNTVSTIEVDEPGGGLKSIWYSWVAPATGKVVFDTHGSELDTLLNIYTGTAVNDLTLIGSNDQSPHSDYGESLVKINVTSGTTYRVRLAVPSYGAPGPLELNWLMVNKPANDDFADAQVITGASGSLSAYTYEASIEEVELNANNNTRSIWYSWTATFTGVMRFDTNGSANATTLTVANNNDLENLNVVSGSHADPARCTFPVINGATYRISISTMDEQAVKLNWQQLTDFVPSVISLGSTTFNATEGGINASITLTCNVGTISGAVPAPVSCYLFTLNGSASSDDYAGTYTLVNFVDGATTATISIPIYQDRRFEGEETFQVRLTNASPDVAFGLSLATVNIADDEPFIPLKANYTGLSQVFPYDPALAGTIKINATGNGSFTGSLLMGSSATAPFSGTFNAAGKSTVTITRKTGGNVLLNLFYADNGNRIRCLISMGGKTADIQAWRIIFGGTVEMNEKPFTLTARINRLPNAVGDVPKADGFLSITVGIKGDVKITGVLADDTLVTAAGQIGGYDMLPLFVPLYKGKGSLCSDMFIDVPDFTNNVFSSDLTWFKEPVPTDKTFKSGFRQATSVDACQYVYSKRNPIIHAVRETQGAADILIKGPGMLVNGATQVFRLLEDNRIALPLNPTVKVTLKFAPATGFFTGTYQMSTEKPTPFKGAVFQPLDTASGFFLAPVPSSSLISSGSIDIKPAY
ncbi:Calx-beta domain-containing protein [Brevifollis gellanilyticus]|uniref:Calx-beta domain-containing protein n=1 Tax=Brevifollis gellanilyticus TaxID=748831 RepID=A0A512MC38_9BACT|nr:Calx-beta domain-containing protein [Brevifollis gellanilyticus]GEP44286.1 hypothetical protein BGE01nite_35770 [Brevifollis gellanilyticus]